MATHHITNEFVDNCPPFNEEDRTALQKILDESIMVAHNAPFDISILEREGLKVPHFIDTLKVCQKLFDEPMYKLQYFRYRFNLQIEARAHDAEGDVLVLEALFNYLMERMRNYDPAVPANEWKNGDSNSDDRIISIMTDISTKPVLIRRITFGKYRGMEFKDLPRDYMRWLSGQSELDEDLKFTLSHYLQVHG